MTLNPVPSDSIVQITGETWNEVISRLKTVEFELRSGRDQRDNRIVVKVQNHASRNIAPFEIVAIGDPVTLPGAAPTDGGYEYQHVFRGESTDKDTQRFGVTLEGIPQDVGGGNKGIGRVVMLGVASAKVNVTDSSHQFATPSSTDGQLQSADAGPIMNLYSHAASVPGVHVCKVLLNPMRQLVKIGKTDADIVAGGTGTVSIWRNGVDTTENIAGVKLDWMHGSQQVSLGKEVAIMWFPDERCWRIMHAECE